MTRHDIHITLVPMRHDIPLDLSRAGNTLIFNGQSVDLSGLGAGGTLSATELNCDWLIGDVTQQDGALHLTLILPYGPGAGAPQVGPDPIRVSDDGPVVLPNG